MNFDFSKAQLHETVENMVSENILQMASKST
jgi:hypothetical protein